MASKLEFEIMHAGEPSKYVIYQGTESEEEKVIDNLLLKEVLGKLDKRERQIIMLRYFEDKTQSEIGDILNISQVQVSRIERKVLDNMRRKLSV